MNFYNLQKQQELFTDPSRFINYLPEMGNARDMFQFGEEPYLQERKIETLTVDGSPENVANLLTEDISQRSLDVYAHIPEDFNLDIETTGDITGMSLNYTKFLGDLARLVSTGQHSSIRASKIRTDVCEISNNEGDVDIKSYVEAFDLRITTHGSLTVGKKLGTNDKASIRLLGDNQRMAVSSIFANMASLPESRICTQALDQKAEFDLL